MTPLTRCFAAPSPRFAGRGNSNCFSPLRRARELELLLPLRRARELELLLPLRRARELELLLPLRRARELELLLPACGEKVAGGRMRGA